MTDTPKLLKNGNTNTLSYVWAILILFLIGVILIGFILWLRPTYDPLIVIGTVGGMITTIMGSLLALMKTQETHVTVNSQLTEWKAESTKAAHSEGVIEGGKVEQERVAEEKRIAALSAPDIAVSGVKVEVPVNGILKSEVKK